MLLGVFGGLEQVSAASFLFSANPNDVTVTRIDLDTGQSTVIVDVSNDLTIHGHLLPGRLPARTPLFCNQTFLKPLASFLEKIGTCRFATEFNAALATFSEAVRHESVERIANLGFAGFANDRSATGAWHKDDNGRAKSQTHGVPAADLSLAAAR
jgi:hypothetical protein